MGPRTFTNRMNVEHFQISFLKTVLIYFLLLANPAKDFLKFQPPALDVVHAKCPSLNQLMMPSPPISTHPQALHKVRGHSTNPANYIRRCALVWYDI